jgi:tRNA threonylcarbamoyladenosine biosynthesis protein TsaE
MEIIYRVNEIEEVARKIVAKLSFPICTLSGDLGAGKTTLLKAICKELGVIDEVNSPTYSIVNEYKTQGNETIYHFDLYRIKSEIELYDLGFEEYLNSKSKCFIEWPKIAKEFLPHHYHAITIEHLNMGKRKMIFGR